MIKKIIKSAFIEGRSYPLLESSDKSKDRLMFLKNKRLIKIYYVYLLTMISIIAFCTVMLMWVWIGHGDGVINDLYGGLSGNGNANNAETESLLSGTLLPSKDSYDTVISKETESNRESETPVDTAVNAGTTVDIYDFDYSSVPSGAVPIIPMDLSMSSYGNTYINNDTGLAVDTSRLLESSVYSDFDIEYLASAPSVLIIHTHGTESYMPNGSVAYIDDGGELARSTDKNENVIAVGRLLNKILNENGISSIHCEIMHDEENYRSAYDNAERTIKEYMDRYPTIKLVIDIHRDAVIRSDGNIVRPIADVGGEAVAQMMCVVGSNQGGEDNPSWERNLSLALQLRKSINDEYINLCRPVYLKSSTYNQEISKYSLLLEIGSIGNSLEEALSCTQIVGEALSELIK